MKTNLSAWSYALALCGLLLALPISTTYAQSDVTQPGDPLIASSDNSPGSEGVANAIDGQPTKYLNFDTANNTTPSGFVVTPSVGATLVTGLTMQSANDAVGRDPLSITLEGSNDEAPTWDTGNWETIYENAAIPSWVETFPGDDRFQTQQFSFDNNKPFLHYRWTTILLQEDTQNSMQIAEVELLGDVVVLATDVTQPGDAIQASSDNSPGSEGVANAIDGQPTKYLNFDTANNTTPSGFVVTPGIGKTVLSGLTMQSANDAVGRDPLSITLEGSNDEAPTWDTGNWETIYENVAIPSWVETFPGDDRFQTQQFSFDNNKPFLHYRWTTILLQEDTQNSMQIAEVELLGKSAPVDVTQPSDPIIASSDNSPGSEGVANAIDNQPTKYLNFDTANNSTPSGFVVSPSVGATTLVGLSMQSANDAVGRDPLSIILEGSNDAAPGWDSGNWETIYENAAVPSWVETFPGDDRFQTQEFFFDNNAAYLHYRWTTILLQEDTQNSMQIAEVELLAFQSSADCSKTAFLTHPVNTPTIEGVGAEFFTEVNGPWPVQWLKNGEPIPGAVQTVYTTDPVTADNAGDVYSVEIVGCDSSNEVQATLFDPAEQPVSIGINFVGGGANGAPTRSDATNIGGGQLQAYWNSLPGEGDGSSAGEESGLLNSRNEATGISVEWSAANRWGSGTGTDDTNAKLFNGLIEGGGTEEEAAFVTFSDVPDGSHSILIYSIARPLEFPNIDFELVQTAERVYMRQLNADEYNAAPGLLQVTSTDPGARGRGNFVRFDGIGPVNGEITLNFWDGGGGNSTINAMQLVLDSEPPPPPPSITSQPVSANGVAGEVVDISVRADGASSYQWRKDGVALTDDDRVTGATSPDLSIAMFSADDEGAYTVAVTNADGTSFSTPAVLTAVTGDIADRLIGHYKFDETSGVKAANSGGTAADVDLMDFAGPSEQWIEGRIGGSLNFNGADNWAMIPTYEKPGQMTVSLWVWTNSAIEFDFETPPEIIRNWGDTEGQFRLRFDGDVDAEEPNFELGTQLTVGPNNPRTDEVNEEEFPVARWEHIAFTANGASLTMYRNGQAVSSSAYLGDISPGIIEGIALGVDVDDAGLPVDGEAYWDGRMDDLGIWGRPLSANEIASIYVNGLEGLDLTNAIDEAVVLPRIPVFDVVRDAATGDFTFSWEADEGLYYAVDTSTDLLSWQELLTGFPDGGATEGALTYTDTNIPQDGAQRYYRARESEAPPFYTEDFEGGEAGWTATMDAGDTPWELGTPSVDGLMAANSGTNAWGTDLDGPYGAGAVSRLRSPVLDLSELSSPKLEFSYYVESTFEEEGGQVNILDENGEVLYSEPEIFWGKTATWTPFALRLPPAARGQKVIVEFVLLTAGAENGFAGWYIDDVTID
jgi:hypothetical protein